MFNITIQILPLLFVCFVLPGCRQANPAEVEKVIDGDSFRLKGGQEVRIIGIDAPEYGTPGADISADFLEKLITRGKVVLQKGNEDKDKYGRWLRYVYSDSVFVNGEMIKKGYAVVRYLSGESKYNDELLRFQQQAEGEQKGLWAFGVFGSVSKQAEGEISPEEAVKYYGKIVIVNGRIVRTYNSGKVCFLNFSEDYKNSLSVVIFSDDFGKFPLAPEKLYLDKQVSVKGMVKEYKGVPEIVIGSPEEIKIIIDP